MPGKKSILEMAEEPPVSLPVTVEAVIGHIDMGAGGQHPFEVGMSVIARYHRARAMLEDGSVGDNVYRFPGPGDNETIVVTVNSEFPNREASDLDRLGSIPPKF